MNATHVLIGLVIGGLYLAAISSRPATARSRSSLGARRLAYLEQHPTHVNSADVLAMLRGDGLPADQAHFIVDKAAEDGIRPFTMWLWLTQFDAEGLGLVVAADVTQSQLLSHIGNDTTPDLEELRLFAALNGFETRGTVPTPTRVAFEAARRDASAAERRGRDGLAA